MRTGGCGVWERPSVTQYRIECVDLFRGPTVIEAVRERLRTDTVLSNEKCTSGSVPLSLNSPDPMSVPLRIRGDDVEERLRLRVKGIDRSVGGKSKTSSSRYVSEAAEISNFTFISILISIGGPPDLIRIGEYRGSSIIFGGRFKDLYQLLQEV